MKCLLTVCFIVMLTLVTSAQANKAQLADYSIAAQFSASKLNKLVFSTEVQPNWFENGQKFWYTYTTSEGRFWYIVDPATGRKRPFFNRKIMAARLDSLTNGNLDPENLPLQHVRFSADGMWLRFDLFQKGFYAFEYNILTDELRKLEHPQLYKPIPVWASFNPDTSRVYYSKGYNLYWMDSANFQKAFKNEMDPSIIEHQITTDGVQYYSWGEEPYSTFNQDNRSEALDLKRRKKAALVWAPNGKHFAIIRKDNRKIKELWVVHSARGKRPSLETYKYLMPGEVDSTESELFLFETMTNSHRRINVAAFKNQTLRLWGKCNKEEDLHHERLTKGYGSDLWLGNNRMFFLSRISRDLKRTNLLAVSTDGTTRTLVTENAELPIEVKRPMVINGGRKFIYWSEKDGWGHFYLYDSLGRCERQLTKGAYHCDELLNWEARSGTFIFRANGKEKGIDPYYAFYYAGNLDGSDPKLLTPGNFDHQAVLDKSGKYLVDNFSRVNTIPASRLFDNEGNLILELETADLSKLFATGYKFPEPFTVKAADGVTDLFGVMYKPFNFAPEKSYPIIENVYPGPHMEAVDKHFTRVMDHTDRLAQMGFIVITVGNRGGHFLRSKWYHTFGYGNLRDYGLKDKLVAVEQLAQRFPFVDRERVGITGHSGGGFMTVSAMLKYPDFFKVGVAESGNYDNRIYNHIWGESYQGIKEVVSGKKDTSFVFKVDTDLELANRLKGKLLIATGEVDNNVHPAHSMRLIDALIRANKRFDFIMLPGQSHVYGSMSEYLFWRMADYFCEYLRGTSKMNEVDIKEMKDK